MAKHLTNSHNDSYFSEAVVFYSRKISSLFSDVHECEA